MSRTRERYARMMATFWRNPRVRKLTDAAIATYCLALSYACDQLNDGILTPDEALTMCARGKKGAIKELVSAGFWGERDGAYFITNYLEHNESRASLEASREQAIRDGKKGGRPKGSCSRNQKGTLSENINGTHAENETHGDGDGEEYPLSPPQGVTVEPDPDQVGTVPWLLACSPRPGYAWRLLHAIAELHPGPDGRPVALPGLAPSANDTTKLGLILEGAEVQAKANGSTAMGELAAEWLALLSLIAAGEMERPKGPMVPYLLACFGRLNAQCIETGTTLLPARTKVAA